MEMGIGGSLKGHHLGTVVVLPQGGGRGEVGLALKGGDLLRAHWTALQFQALD
jgi:hypothetical protein